MARLSGGEALARSLVREGVERGASAVGSSQFSPRTTISGAGGSPSGGASWIKRMGASLLRS